MKASNILFPVWFDFLGDGESGPLIQWLHYIFVHWQRGGDFSTNEGTLGLFSRVKVKQDIGWICIAPHRSVFMSLTSYFDGQEVCMCKVVMQLCRRLLFMLIWANDRIKPYTCSLPLVLDQQKRQCTAMPVKCGPRPRFGSY